MEHRPAAGGTSCRSREASFSIRYGASARIRSYGHSGHSQRGYLAESSHAVSSIGGVWVPKQVLRISAPKRRQCSTRHDWTPPSSPSGSDRSGHCCERWLMRHSVWKSWPLLICNSSNAKKRKSWCQYIVLGFPCMQLLCFQTQWMLYRWTRVWRPSSMFPSQAQAKVLPSSAIPAMQARICGRKRDQLLSQIEFMLASNL